MFPMGDRAGGELCLRNDLDGVTVAAGRALNEISKDSPLRPILDNIVDIATRHPKADS